MFGSNLKKLLDMTPRQSYHRILQGKLYGKEPLITFDGEHPCLFVLSTGRVGTQTIASLMELAGNILSYHEPSPKLFGLSKLAYRYHNEPSIQEVLVEAFKVARRDKLAYALSCGKGYVETSPQSTFLAPIIASVIQQAKFIHLVRHPYDVIRSGMRRNWYAGQVTDSNRIVPLPNTLAAQSWSNTTIFQKNIWLWAETNRWIHEYCATLPREQWVMIRSEDLFAQQPETIEQLFQFIGTSTPALAKIQQVLAKQLNAQSTGTFPDPEQWSEHMHQELTNIAGDTAMQIGYELV